MGTIAFSIKLLLNLNLFSSLFHSVLKLVQNGKPGNLCSKLRCLQKREEKETFYFDHWHYEALTCQTVKAKGVNEKLCQSRVCPCSSL